MRHLKKLFLSVALFFWVIGACIGTNVAESAGNVDVGTYDVSSGFEKEVRLDQLTKLDWTLRNGNGTYHLTLDLPGKQLPAKDWKDFYNKMGWDIAQPNQMKITFSDGSSGTLYADVIGNSGKVRFWMDAVKGEAKEKAVVDKIVEKKVIVQKEKAVEKQIQTKVTEGVAEKQTKEVVKYESTGNEKIKVTIVKKERTEEGQTIELKLNTSLVGTWYIWVNSMDQHIVTKDHSVILKGLTPGTHIVNVELKNNNQTLESYTETFFIPTDDGGILPETASPWPTMIVMGFTFLGVGIIVRRFAGV